MTATISITPIPTDLIIERGDAAALTLTALDKTGAAMNFTACSIRFSVKPYEGRTWDSSPAVVALTWSESASNGITVANIASGIVAITIPKATTAALGPNVRYRWDVEITDANGNPTTTHEGDVTVTADVSV